MPYQIVPLYYILHRTYLVPRHCHPRVILSEAAHRVKGRTRSPNNAAQSNPAPLAGRQQAGSPLFQRDRVTHPAYRGSGQRVVRGVMWSLLASEIPPAGAPLGAGFAVRQ